MAKDGSILLNCLDLGPKKTKQIISVLGSIDKILEVTAAQLREACLTAGEIEKIVRFRDSKEFKGELELIRKEGIICLDIFDSEYPELLKEIASPPLVLYIKGDLKALSGILFAIVGTRVPTSYGIDMARDFSSKLAALGFIIVSGLAKGVDTVAHEAAIKTNQTIAVLGSGLLKIYPWQNIGLAAKIIKNGALISEFPLLRGPARENFPRRNRIVSGLSKGVLVVEAAEKSGARITARFACEQNREVFVLPGNADSALSKGNHILIKEGAKLTDCVEDILEELRVTWQNI